MSAEAARATDTAAWGRRAAAATDCPNCGGAKDYIGICGPCYHRFEATPGGWPVWQEFLKRIGGQNG